MATLSACGLVVLVALGLVVLHRIGKGSPLRTLHGKYVLVWMIVGWTLASVADLIFRDVLRDDTGGVAIALFGMLAGWVIGMAHGGLVVWWRVRYERRFS